MAESNSTAVSTEKVTALLASKATEWIMSDIKDGKITAPAGYDVGSEMFSAMLTIAQTTDRNGKPALQACTQESILSSLRDMAIQGISMSKKQCYPIVYGSTLNILRSYFGTISVFNRMFPDYKVTADVLYEGDEYVMMHDDLFDFDYIVIKSRSLENRDKPIVAAYGSIVDMTKRERIYGCVMTMKEIRTSWSHAKTDKVQREFPQEMAKRTLINRMLKFYVNSVPETNSAIAGAFNRSTEEEYDYNDTRLKNVTPEEADTARILKSRSQGEKGLSSILQARKATVAKASAETPEKKEEPIIERKDNPKTEQKKINDMPVPEETIDMSTGEIISQPVGPEGFSDEELPF